MRIALDLAFFSSMVPESWHHAEGVSCGPVVDKSKVGLWVTSTHKSNQSCDSKEDTHGTLKCQLVHIVCLHLKEARISPF